LDVFGNINGEEVEVIVDGKAEVLDSIQDVLENVLCDEHPVDVVECGIVSIELRSGAVLPLIENASKLRETVSHILMGFHLADPALEVR